MTPNSKLAQKSTFGSDETERGLNIMWHKKKMPVRDCFGIRFSMCGPEGCGSVVGGLARAHSPHTTRSADASSMPLELLAMQV